MAQTAASLLLPLQRSRIAPVTGRKGQLRKSDVTYSAPKEQDTRQLLIQESSRVIATSYDKVGSGGAGGAPGEEEYQSVYILLRSVVLCIGYNRSYQTGV